MAELINRQHELETTQLANGSLAVKAARVSARTDDRETKHGPNDSLNSQLLRQLKLTCCNARQGTVPSESENPKIQTQEEFLDCELLAEYQPNM